MAATRLALSIQSDRQEKVSWGTPAASLTATTELLSIYCILESRGSVHVFGFSQAFFLLVFFHRPSAYSIATDKHWLREMFSECWFFMCLSEQGSFPFSAWLELVSSLETLWLCRCNSTFVGPAAKFCPVFWWRVLAFLGAKFWMQICLDRHGKVVYMLAQANLANGLTSSKQYCCWEAVVHM